VMWIIGALYERGPIQQEIPRERQPWNPPLKKSRARRPATPTLSSWAQHELHEVKSMRSRRACPERSRRDPYTFHRAASA